MTVVASTEQGFALGLRHVMSLGFHHFGIGKPEPLSKSHGLGMPITWLCPAKAVLAEKERSAGLRRRQLLLQYRWDCGVVPCDGHPYILGEPEDMTGYVGATIAIVRRLSM